MVGCWSWSTSPPRSGRWRSPSPGPWAWRWPICRGGRCRIADLHPGQAKTDARDAHVIADTARSKPHTLRRVGGDDETLAELTVLAGYDDDLARGSPPG